MASLSDGLFGEEDLQESTEALSTLSDLLQKYSNEEDSRTSAHYKLLRAEASSFVKFEETLRKTSSNKQRQQQINSQKEEIKKKNAAIKKQEEDIRSLQDKINT